MRQSSLAVGAIACVLALCLSGQSFALDQKFAPMPPDVQCDRSGCSIEKTKSVSKSIQVDVNRDAKADRVGCQNVSPCGSQWRHWKERRELKKEQRQERRRCK